MGKKSNWPDSEIRDALSILHVEWNSQKVGALHGNIRQKRKALKKLGYLGYEVK